MTKKEKAIVTPNKKHFKRILNISDDASRITLTDNRYYRRNGKYYPSITTVLDIFPKGKWYTDFLKKHGMASDQLVYKASVEGTVVHDLIERYLTGEEITILYPDGNLIYQPHIWQMFLNFVEFWETYKPTLIEVEVHLFSDELKVAGTCDLICEIDGEIWLIDFKTSNQISQTYEIQTAIYGKCFEECYGKKIDKYGILWLKSSKRKFNKEKMTGKGWEIVLPTRKFEENLEIFKTLQSLYNLVNPKQTPYDSVYRTTVKWED